MTTEVLFDAIGMIDDDLLQWQPRKKINFRRTGMVLFAAVLAAVLLAMGALAVSPGLREAVFSVFRVGSVEIPPAVIPDSDAFSVDVSEPTVPGLNDIGAAEFDGAVNVHYFLCSGYAYAHDGVLYTCDRNGNHTNPMFWRVTQDGVEQVYARRVDFLYSWSGTDFRILFDCAIINGELQVVFWPENMDLDPYRYGWSVETIGDRTDVLLLTLPDFGRSYSMHPMLLDLNTLEIKEVIPELPVDGIVPAGWWFTENLHWAKMYAYAWNSEEKDGDRLCDLWQGIVYSPEEFFGEGVTEFSFLRDGSAMYIQRLSGSRVNLWHYDFSTEERTLVLENVTKYNSDTQVGYRLSSLGPYCAYYAFVRYENGYTDLVDLRTGEKLSLGELDWSGLTTSESPEGSHIFFSWKFKRIGMLDTSTGTLSLLDRQIADGVLEYFYGWLSEDTVVISANTDGGYYETGYYIYIYDFSKEGSRGESSNIP